MKTRLFASLLMLAACGDETPTSPTDAGTSDNTGADGSAIDAQASDSSSMDADAGDAQPTHVSDPRTATLAESLRKWQALAAENPGPYWYEDENCLINFSEGTTHVIEVDQELASVVGSRGISAGECTARVNRFGTLVGDGSFEALHEVCAGLLESRRDTTFSVDAQGIVDQCWVGDDDNCQDNCGIGFVLIDRGFGPAPAVDAGTP